MTEEADLAVRIRTAVGRLGRGLRLTHADKNLSPSQRDVLGTIARRGSIGLSELATLEGLNPTMLSRIVGKLELAGLVVRTQDPRDARAAQVTATDAGHEAHEQIRAERTDALLLALGQLSEDERDSLGAALGALESLAEALRRTAP